MCWTRALDESQTIAANLRIEAVKQPASRCDNDNTLVFMRIDGRNALVGIDKQPFPVERHRLDRQRFARSCHWRQGVELVRPDPCDAAKQNDRKGRDGPDHELDASRIGPLGQVGRAFGSEARNQYAKPKTAARSRANRSGSSFLRTERPLRVEDIHPQNRTRDNVSRLYGFVVPMS